MGRFLQLEKFVFQINFFFFGQCKACCKPEITSTSTLYPLPKSTETGDCWNLVTLWTRGAFQDGTEKVKRPGKAI